MSEFEYSYSILKYRHDASAGEVLNVGVVVYSSATGQVGVIYDHRYSRLSQTFANFDGDLYKSVLNQLQTAIHSIAKPLSGNLFEIEARLVVPDVAKLIRQAWPDQGLSYFAGPVAYGIAEDLDRELTELCDRFILSQFDRRESQARFGDEQLWDHFKRLLTPRGVVQALRPVTLADVEFEHAYKNERWHVFEALSLDYVGVEDMKTRAYEVLGKATLVTDSEDFGSMTILLGPPKRVDADRQYKATKQMLRNAPGRPRIVEESEAEAFASEIENEMRLHGVIA